MKRILSYYFAGLMIVTGIWPAQASQTRPFFDVSQFRGARFVPGRVLVKYRGEAAVRLVHLPAGEDVMGRLQSLSYDARVEYAEPDLIYTIDKVSNDPRQAELWGMRAVRATDAWEITTGSQDVVVAVTDTGIDYTHPDLSDNMWRNLGEVPNNGRDDDFNGYVDDYYGWNGYSNNGHPLDDNDHGTHVAGTIGAVGDNNAGVVGVNWRVKLMALKFLGSDGSGSLSDAIEVINYAIFMKQRGVNVVAINASWGGGGYSRTLEEAIDRATAAGILFVAAAGNESTSAIEYPGGYRNALAVAAVEMDGQTLASFSNYGSWVDVAAPGRSILSTVRGNRYASFSGTSMATPHVAGLAGLLASVAPLSVQQLRQAIENHVRVVPSLQGKVQTGGLIDAAASVGSLSSSPPPPPTPSQNTPPTVTLAASSTTVNAGTPVNITATAFDPDQDPLTYQWQTSGGQIQGQGSAVTLNTSGISSSAGTPVPVTVQVLVSDGRGGFAQNQVVINVTPQAAPAAKFSLQITPTLQSIRSGRVLYAIQITRTQDYQNGGAKLDPIVLNNQDEVFAVVVTPRPRKGKQPTTATMYVSLLTARPSASEYRLQVKGTDDFGGEVLSNIVTATLP